MLAIRMQRTGRKGHAMYRMVVQDSRRTPTSGKIVAYLGSYDPHNKLASVDSKKASFYLEHGAQPSPRAVLILKSNQVKLPDWVDEPKHKQRAVRNPDKRRSTAPAPEPAKTEEVEVDPPVVETEPTPEANSEVTAEATETEPAEVVDAAQAPIESDAA